MDQETIDLREGLEEAEALRVVCIQQAGQCLEKKYGREFEIHRIGNTRQADLFFRVEASPRQSPELRFLADVARDGSGVTDQYVSRMAAGRMEERVMGVLSEYFETFSVKVSWGDKWDRFGGEILSADTFIAARFLTAGAAENPVVVRLDLLSEGRYGTELQFCEGMRRIAEIYPHLSGVITASIVPLDTFTQLLIFVREHANVDHSYQEIKKGCPLIKMHFEHGTVKIPAEEFRDWYVRGGRQWDIQPKI